MRSFGSFIECFGLFFDQIGVAIRIIEGLLSIGELLVPLFWITIVGEFFVPTMGRSWLVSCLDRAPVPLGTSSDLDRIRKKSVHIATVETLELVLDIEILEEASLVGDVVSPVYLGDAIEWEGAQLIDRDTYIEEYRRDDHSEDERHRDQLSDVHGCDSSPEQWGSICRVLLLEGFEEPYPILLERKTILARKSIIFFSQLIIEGFDLGEDIADSVFHMRVLVAGTDHHLRMAEYAI